METFELTRWLFQKSLALIYLTAFLVAAFQVRPLIGKDGLLPASLFLKRVHFKDYPSIFWWNCSDRVLVGTAWCGVFLSLIAFTGIFSDKGFILSGAVWLLLWLVYLSYVNIGQLFYGYGWETLLLETGFLAIFLGPSDVQTSIILMFFIRWILFRVMFGAGMIKLRGDKCWKDLTCLYYHYETQPMPNPFSWYFHHLPHFIQRQSVLFTHFVQLIVPWGLLMPAPICYISGGIIIFFQLTLIISGNLSWLNHLTLLLCIACFDDKILSSVIPFSIPAPQFEVAGGYLIALILLSILIVILSIKPTINLFSNYQMMNASFDPLHLVNTYGAFGSISRERFEIIIEGTSDSIPNEATEWKEYEFKGKPGRISKRPPFVAPYHYRLDWQMWFAAMSNYEYNRWFIHLISKLLINDQETLKLLGKNPFPHNPPKCIRAFLYKYRFTKWDDPSGNWWERELIKEYFPEVRNQDTGFRTQKKKF